MSSAEVLKLAIDASSLDETRRLLDTIADAAARAKSALADLQGQPHGGIDIKIVGAIAHVEIKPVA